ncbi:MAG: ribonuclease R [Ignavibacteriaceae bacterium]|nr:ribonuclease R [Ignavibacteriaceae bacterium]HRN26334.1 ribonuclease R [Ignavibacteriaceae bacterium]HRQ53581.1 ribonuclease R [Ignavibacteriaceae bacterium]
MKKELKAFFNRNQGRGFKSKDIADKLGFNADHEYASLKAVLHKLESESFLIRVGKKYQLNKVQQSNRLKGRLEINRNGFGFVNINNEKHGDIFIAARNIGTAFDGDLVEVELFAKQKGKNIEGQIVSIVERKRKEYVGVIKKSKSFFFISLDDPKLHRDIYITEAKLNGAKTGDKVVVGKLVWDSSMLNPEGEVIEVLGKSGSHETDIVSIAREFDLKYKFSAAVLAEAENISTAIPQEEIKKRLDYRSKNVFTIDPEDAKDFDDALSLEKLENGNLSIGIHIADVSHYVKQNSSLDAEAYERGNSVYFVGRVIPMLPEKLSNQICSLVPFEDRLTYSVIIEMTPRGKIINYSIDKTIINSKRRFTYEDAQKVIESGKGDLAEDILQLNKIAEIYRKKRMREGSFNFISPEVKFILDENGVPVSIIIKQLKQSNMLVEEFMLLANKLVATQIAVPKSGAVKPFVYRIHDLPDQEKIVEFSRFVKTLGYTFDPNASSKSIGFQNLLNQVKGKAEEVLINELAIRSMAKAIYSPNNIGHYGLGFNYYSHFTSPIRRYSDLIVHRLIFNYQYLKSGEIYSLAQLEEICENISASERNAVEAERFSVKQKQIEYLKNNQGDEFSAIISGITNFGIFVKITEILAEGLVRLRDLDDDYYIHDEKNYSIVGKRTKKQYRLGDKIYVKLIRVDEERSELDFKILESKEEG